MKDRLLSYSLVAVIAIAVVNAIATYFYLYWTVWWFDNISHFLGGLAMGLFTFWIFRRGYPLFQPLGWVRLVSVIIFFVLIIGVGWEIFEYLFDLAEAQIGETYWQDTAYDIVADTLGAIVASIIIYKKKLYE